MDGMALLKERWKGLCGADPFNRDDACTRKKLGRKTQQTRSPGAEKHRKSPNIFESLLKLYKIMRSLQPLGYRPGLSLEVCTVSVGMGKQILLVMAATSC